MSGWRDVLPRLSRARVAVVGDVMLDAWVFGTAERLCREAPVPVVNVTHTGYAPGGAGNTAANLACLGAQVRLYGTVGDDAAAERVRDELRHRGVDDTGMVVVGGRPTTVKHRVLADGQIIARYDQEVRAEVPHRAERELAARIEEAIDQVDAVVACDYGKGALTGRLRRLLGDMRGDDTPKLVVDARDPRPWVSCRPHALLPSFTETLRLLGERAPDDAGRVRFLCARSSRLLALTGARVVVTTLDGEGTLTHLPDRPPHRTYATPAPERLAAGAGDTFTAAFTAALAAGSTAEAAADLAQMAADVVVRRPGTATCTRHDLARRLRREGRGVLGAEALARRLEEHRQRGERIVFTNGCFDVVHRGHVTYLRQARELGDLLVVALNSDASVTRLKGPDRPINTLEDRAALINALTFVDYVTAFDEDVPNRLLHAVRPDVYVKGGDYGEFMLPEAALVERLGGEVRILDYVPGRSTTEIVDRIRTRQVS